MRKTTCLTTLLGAWVAVLFVLAGCPEDGPAGDDDAEDDDGGDDDGGDDDGGDDDTGPGPEYGFTLIPSSRAVLTGHYGDSLTVSWFVTEDGLPRPVTTPVSMEFTPSDGVTESVPDVYTFEEYGIWTVEAYTEVEQTTVSDSVEVTALIDFVDPVAAQVGLGLGTAHRGLAEILAASGGDDAEMTAAVEDLANTEQQLSDVALDDILQLYPYYPDTQSLEAAGIFPNADDAALPGALEDLAGVLNALTHTLDSLDATNPTQDDVDLMAEQTEALELAVETLVSMNPTDHGWLAVREQLASLLTESMIPFTLSTVAYVELMVETQMANPSPPDDPPPPFGLLGFSLQMTQSAYFHMSFVNKMYGWALEELAATGMAWVAMQGLSYLFPESPQGPVIEILLASATPSIAMPGYDSWIFGHNFSTNMDFNGFIILGDAVLGTVLMTWEGCGIAGSQSIPDAVGKITDCFNAIVANMGETFGWYTVELFYPGTLADFDLHMQPFPPVCSGYLPAAVWILPISGTSGAGEPFATTCMPY